MKPEDPTPTLIHRSIHLILIISSKTLSEIQWNIPAILIPGRQKQDDQEFVATPSFTAKFQAKLGIKMPCLKQMLVRV